MNVQIKLIDPSLPLPAYQTAGSVAFDLYSRIDIEVAPKSIVLVPLNIIVKTPEGYVFLISPRSSLAKKKGLFQGNHIGVIDQDYCGESDEVLFCAYNFTDEIVRIEKGERIAQGMFLPVEKVGLIQVEKMDDKNRGGFGSTG
ncbi:MAG TPA: dUTP diphosphatase [Patescibacteria group bacterium]|nr:dUTP diphosphatase [Patescibacteria group bacterium]